MKKKCGQCGVVNWEDAVECVRCGSNLNISQQKYTKGESSETGSFSFTRFGVILTVSLSLCLVGYQTIGSSDNTAGPAVNNTATNAPATGPNAAPRGKFFNDIAKDLEKKTKKDYQGLNQNSYTNERNMRDLQQSVIKNTKPPR